MTQETYLREEEDFADRQWYHFTQSAKSSGMPIVEWLKEYGGSRSINRLARYGFINSEEHEEILKHWIK